MLQPIQPSIGTDCLQLQNKLEVVSSGHPFHSDSLTSVEAVKKSGILNRLWNGLMWLPNKLIYVFKRILSTLFCCFPSCQDKVNWKQTKVIFDRIVKVVLHPGEFSGDKDCRARFQEALSDLSVDALERFKWHIGITRAQEAKPELSHSACVSWYNQHREAIDFKHDYFDAIRGNTVLEKAVKSFRDEINRHV